MQHSLALLIRYEISSRYTAMLFAREAQRLKQEQAQRIWNPLEGRFSLTFCAL
jgi:hypothetical protein